jgi:hypothetical protein
MKTKMTTERPGLQQLCPKMTKWMMSLRLIAVTISVKVHPNLRVPWYLMLQLRPLDLCWGW